MRKRHPNFSSHNRILAAIKVYRRHRLKRSGGILSFQPGGVRNITLMASYGLTSFTEIEPDERVADFKRKNDSLELVNGKWVLEYEHDTAKYRTIHLKVQCIYKGTRHTFQGYFHLAKPRSSEKGRAF